MGHKNVAFADSMTSARKFLTQIRKLSDIVAQLISSLELYKIIKIPEDLLTVLHSFNSSLHKLESSERGDLELKKENLRKFRWQGNL